MSTFPRRLTSRLLKIGTPVVLSVGVTLSVLHFRGRHCYANASFNPRQDPIFQHPWMKRINPFGNPSFHDSWERTARFDEIQPDLLRDALNGGSSLVEHFASGVLGGRAFDIQRNIMKLARKSEANKQDLWESDELRRSKFPKGTIIADDFVVIEKLPSLLMLRGGLSPRVAPEGPREMDTVIILEAQLDTKSQVVRFRLKSVVLNGTEAGTKVPIDSVSGYLHEVYAKVLLSVGLEKCLA